MNTVSRGNGSATSASRSRRALWVGLAVAGVFAAPAACLYPSYTFDLPGAGGGGASGATTTATGLGGTTTATATTTGHPTSTSSGHAGRGGEAGHGGHAGHGGAAGQGGKGVGGHAGSGGVGVGGHSTGAAGAGGTGGSTTSSTSSTGGTGGTGGVGGIGGMDAGTCTVADCSNPACNPLYACVDAPPVGWTGPVALYSGPTANADPGCPASYPGNIDAPFLGNAGFSAAQATCSACTCSAPTGETCTLPTEVDSYDDPTCGTKVAQYCKGPLPTPAWGGGCVGLPGNGIFGGATCGNNSGPMCNLGSSPCDVSVTSAAPTVSGGSCTPAGGVATLPDVAWTTFARGCGDPEISAPGCGNGLLCLPKPEAPFQTGVCVYQAGNVASCPAAFSHRHLFDQGATDTRACTGCSCGAAAGASCSASIKVYSIPGCSSLVTTFTAGTCTPLAGNPDIGGVEATITAPPSGGACPAAGGAPTGAASATQPTTFCCTQ